MRVLLTGGFGVNGRWATEQFVAAGHDVAVLDSRDDRAILGSAAEFVTTFVADITDLDAVERVLATFCPEVVVHMAAVVGANPPMQVFEVNATGTANVLEAAHRVGIRRVVFTSSRAVYGNIVGAHAHPTYDPYDEQLPYRPVHMYDYAKIVSEGLGRHYAAIHGLEFVALRFASIFGPGKDVRHTGTSIYSRMIDLAAAGEPVVIPQGGDQRDDVIYVEDVARSVVLAATVPEVLSPAYNISRGVGTTLHELADAIRVAIPDADITIGEGLDYFQIGAQYYGVMSNQLAAREIGFVPEFDLVTGVAQYLERSGH